MGEYQVRKQGQIEIVGQGTQGCVLNDAWHGSRMAGCSNSSLHHRYQWVLSQWQLVSQWTLCQYHRYLPVRLWFGLPGHTRQTGLCRWVLHFAKCYAKTPLCIQDPPGFIPLMMLSRVSECKLTSGVGGTSCLLAKGYHQLWNWWAGKWLTVKARMLSPGQGSFVPSAASPSQRHLSHLVLACWRWIWAGLLQCMYPRWWLNSMFDFSLLPQTLTSAP